MTQRSLWSIETRIPPSSLWSSAHLPTDDELTEEETDKLIETYRRAMPMKEFRKRETLYDDFNGSDDDIPF